MAERIKTELKKLKQNRGYYAGTITKAHNRLLRMLDGDPATHDQEQLEKMRSSINRVETQMKNPGQMLSTPGQTWKMTPGW